MQICLHREGGLLGRMGECIHHPHNMSALMLLHGEMPCAARMTDLLQGPLPVNLPLTKL